MLDTVEVAIPLAMFRVTLSRSTILATSPLKYALPGALLFPRDANGGLDAKSLAQSLSEA